jgi:flagellar basal body-associated protein FliL
MSSPHNQNPGSRGIDWLGITRILILQLVVLLAVAGAFIRYLNWSSNAAWAEFSPASKPAASEANPRPRSAAGSRSPVPTVLRPLRLTET